MHEVERAAIEAVGVDERIHRLDDVVDRDEVGRAEVRADQWQPAGPGEVPDPGERLHQVVRTVDLVDVAGRRVADDDGRTVDPPRDRRLLSDQPLRLVLGGVVGRGQVLALGEHVLGEAPDVLPGDRDRADVVQAAGAEGVGDLDHPAGALDVGLAVALVVGGHVVQRCQVHDVIDPAERLAGGGGQAQRRLGQVTDEREDPVPAVEPGRERLEPGHRVGPDQYVHRRLRTTQQPLQQVPSEKACPAGDQVGRHRVSPLSWGDAGRTIADQEKSCRNGVRRTA